MRPEMLIALMTKPWIPDVGHFAMRVTLGALLVYHGTSKVFEGMQGLADHLAELGWPMPALQAFAASYIEFAGGVCIMVGLFTRPLAFLNVCMFTIITFVYHGGDPFRIQEKALLFLVMSFLLALIGPGRWSVDARLFAADTHVRD